jgi:hypothetical protein
MPWQIATRTRSYELQQIPILIKNDIPFRGITMSKVSRSKMPKSKQETTDSDG